VAFMMRKTRFMLSSMLVFLLTSSNPASAQEKLSTGEEAPAVEATQPAKVSSLDIGQIDRVFREMPFGEGGATLLSVLRERFLEQLKPVLRATLDAAERDNLHVKMEQAFTGLKDSFHEFKGGETGFAVSVIADEFVQNVGEAIYKYDYGDSVAYFFFSNNRLWKVYLCLQPDQPFVDFVRFLVEKYGEPKEVTWQDEEKSVPAKLVWEDDTFKLRAMPPVDIFVCNRMIWEFKPLLPQVTAARKAVEKDQDPTFGSQFLLNSVTGVDEEDDSNVVDDVIRQRKSNNE